MFFKRIKVQLFIGISSQQFMRFKSLAAEIWGPWASSNKMIVKD